MSILHRSTFIYGLWNKRFIPPKWLRMKILCSVLKMRLGMQQDTETLHRAINSVFHRRRERVSEQNDIILKWDFQNSEQLFIIVCLYLLDKASIRKFHVSAFFFFFWPLGQALAVWRGKTRDTLYIKKKKKGTINENTFFWIGSETRVDTSSQRQRNGYRCRLAHAVWNQIFRWTVDRVL